MNLLYISLPEILVFSDAYYFFENIVNMKKIGKVLVIRCLWFLDEMIPLRKIYSCTTITPIVVQPYLYSCTTIACIVVQL